MQVTQKHKETGGNVLVFIIIITLTAAFMIGPKALGGTDKPHKVPAMTGDKWKACAERAVDEGIGTVDECNDRYYPEPPTQEELDQISNEQFLQAARDRGLI